MTSQIANEKNTQKQNGTTPSIYVACLSAYNSGILHGRWISLDKTEDEVRDEIVQMLASSPIPGAEEHAIHDYQGFGTLRLSEYESIEDVVALAELISEHGRVATEVVSHVGGTEYLDEAKRLLDEQYQGGWDTVRDWVEDLLDSTGELEQIPEYLRGYFDFDSYANDLELGGDIFTIDLDSKAHIFLAG